MAERDFRTYVRETVTIIRPLPSTYERGLNSDLTNMPPVSIRIPESHREPIELAAKLLGVTKSEFIRWCAHQVAIDIVKQHTEFQQLS